MKLESSGILLCGVGWQTFSTSIGLCMYYQFQKISNGITVNLFNLTDDSNERMWDNHRNYLVNNIKADHQGKW